MNNNLLCMPWNSFIKKLHLILGTLSSAGVLVIALSGSLYALQDEIQNLLFDYRYVEVGSGNPLSPTALKSIAESYLNDTTSLRLHRFAPDRSVAVLFNNPQNHGYVFLDPYRGEVLHYQDFQKDFFGLLLKLHMYLFLPPDLGKIVVGTICIVFLLVMLSGFLLWVDLKTFKLWIWKAGAGWKRKNFDLHRNLGVLSLIFALNFVVTGLIWAFPWYENTVYQLLAGKKEALGLPSLQTKIPYPEQNLKTDFLWDSLINARGNELNYTLYFPKPPSVPLIISVNDRTDTYSRLEFLAFEPKSGNSLPVSTRFGPDQEAGLADRFLKRNYDIHTGGIAGIFGKILALFASLSIGVLPVTGILVFIGKRKKRK